MKIKENSAQPAPRSTLRRSRSTLARPRFSIRKHISFWSLTFNGQEACFDHEQGAYYVAYLLLNPPDEPIHGMALDVKAHGHFRQLSGETLAIDPATGATITVGYDALIVERSLGLDEAEGLDYLWRKQKELEKILEDTTASEPVKAEVQRELQELYAYQATRPAPSLTTAQSCVRNVRRAIRRLQARLAEALTPDGKPHPVLRPFAQHLEQYLLIPSTRYCKPGAALAREGTTGTFTYEPPPGVSWS